MVYKRGSPSCKRRASFVLLADPVESLILFIEKIRGKGVKKTLYIDSGASAQKENNQKRSSIQQGAGRLIKPVVSVGDQRMCPECRSVACVVWVSQDKKTMGVQCHRSHREASRPQTKYGATVVRSTKTRKNIVFLTAAA